MLDDRLLDDSGDYESAVTAMGRGDVPAAMDHLSRFINTQSAADEVPSELLIRAEDKLRTCVANLGSVVFAESAAEKHK